MDQLKTRLLNIISASFFKEVKYVLLFVSDKLITAHVLTGMSEELESISSHSITIKESMLDALTDLITEILKNKKIDLRYKFIMILDDYYLKMNRYNFSEQLLKNIDDSIQVEFELIKDYEYQYTFAPKESNKYETVLVYMYKKANMEMLESAFKSQKRFLRRILSRYHVVTALIQSKLIEMNNDQLNIVVDISTNRARLYYAINGKIKVYRRIVLKKLESSKKIDLNKYLIDQVSDFISATMSSYLLKNTNQKIGSIYWLSDFIDSKSVKSFTKVDKVPVEPLALNDSFTIKGDVPTSLIWPYFIGTYEYIRQGGGFNLIPFLKRFELLAIKAIAGIAFIFIFISLISTGIEFASLKKQYSKLMRSSRGINASSDTKRRELIKSRNRYQDQLKVMGYADLIEASKFTT